MFELLIFFSILFFIYNTCDYKFKTYGTKIIDDDEFDIEVTHNLKWYSCFIFTFIYCCYLFN